MGALTAARPGSVRDVTRDARPLAAGVKVYKGALAVCIVSSTGKGYFAPASSALAGVAVGRFYEDVDNTSGAAGAVSAVVHHFKERHVFLLNNDTGTPVAVTDREGLCYALDDQTVTEAVNSCAAGVVYDVTSEGVWVEVDVEPQSAMLAPGISAVAPVDPSSTAAAAGIATLAAAQDHKHHIALATPAAEGLMSTAYASAIHAPVANMAGLTAIAAADRAAGMICMVLSDTASEVSLWRFHATSTAADTSVNLVAVPDAGSGRWLRADKTVSLFLPVTKDSTDNSTIFTVPVGARLRPKAAWWEVTTSWTGGSSSAIGVHASPSGWSTKGDILGGAAGDVLATLVSTDARMTGTVGAKLDGTASGNNRLLLIAADTLKFDRITSAFTAGAANVRVLCDVLTNPGA